MAKNIFSENKALPLDKSYLLDPSIEEKKQEVVVKSDIEEIPLEKLVKFANHPFSVNTDSADFAELVKSIEENGIINEILVRPMEDNYEIISGHRRVAAAKKVGLEKIPARVKELSDYEATVAMVHSNMYRDKILASEKAKAYRMIRDAESHRGIKGVDTAAIIGEQGNDSRRTVYRYIKLSYLNDELLNKVDNEEIALLSGVELGYLDEESQKNVTNFIDQTGYKLSLEEAIKLKERYSESGDTLELPSIISTLAIEKKGGSVAPKEKKSISFKVDALREYFGDVVDTFYMENIILKLLEKYSAGDINIDD